MRTYISAYENLVAAKGGWVWKKVAELEPGDVQVFAGRHMHISKVVLRDRQATVYYEDAPTRVWSTGTHVGVLPDELKSTAVVDA